MIFILFINIFLLINKLKMNKDIFDRQIKLLLDFIETNNIFFR